jgi:hypothetical protein
LAKHSLNLFKSAKQAFLNRDIRDEKIYERPPDWWPEHVSHGYVLELMKSMYGTQQAARQWHVRISSWMEEHGYITVNSEKNIFMKHEVEEWIMHGLFMHDMIHASTSDNLSDKFLSEYQEDFNIILKDVMSSLLGMKIEHNKRDLTIHLDTYIQETLAEYKAAATKFLKPKQMPMRPRIMLELEDCPESPDPVKQKVSRSFVAKVQFAASWVCCNIIIMIAFTASLLARFCASAGPSHWAALHHVMGFLEENPSFKLSYQRGGVRWFGWIRRPRLG